MSIRETLRSWLGFGTGVAMGGFGCNYTPGSRTDAEPEATADTRPDNFDGGVDSHESLPDRTIDTSPDTGSDTATCDRTPRVFTGDGTYTIRPGDKVIASNNVSFEMISGCPHSYDFLANSYIRTDRLNQYPLLVNTSNPDYCADYYGVTVRADRSRRTECGPETNISIESLYPGPIESRQNLYDGCRTAGHSHSVCSEFIPHEPAASETVYADGIFQTITPADAVPAFGQYYLRQLELAHESLMALFGIPEGTSPISFRLYQPDGGSPWTREAIHSPMFGGELDYIRNEESGGLTEMASNGSVIIGLEFFMLSHLTLQSWMEAGLSKYAEVHATNRNTEHEPFFRGTFPLGANINMSGRPPWTVIRFSDYDERTGSVREEVSGLRFTDRSYMPDYSHPLLLAVDRVTNSDITISAFEDAPFDRSHGWIGDPKTICSDASYTENHGTYINGEFYRNVLRTPELHPYASLTTRGWTPITVYENTAYCLFEGILTSG